MTVSCPECRSVFRVDPAKVPATGVRARCSVCGGVIAIAGGTLPVSVTPIGASAAVPAFPGGVSRATPIASGATAPAAARPAARPTPVTSPRSYTPAALPAQGAVPAPRAPTPAAVPVTFPIAPGRAPTPAVSPAIPTPVAGVSVAPGPAPTPVAGPVVSAVAAPNSAPMGGASGIPSSTLAPTPTGARPPINPFLRADPSQRARRLARALVSDLVAYHPQKREEGLRDGTLRQLFREEIKKSYEEYVEQVGREVAESAPHFQDALNEILAGGRRLF